jgi:hypothetical protein
VDNAWTRPCLPSADGGPNPLVKAPAKVLTERLKWLVDHGVVRREEYSSRPPRFEYALTAKGLELCDLLLVMVRWGDRWTAGEAGPPVLYRHHACGRISHVDLRCAECGKSMHANDIDVLPGPGTSTGTNSGTDSP